MDENLFSWFGHFYWLKGDEKMARIISIVNQKGGTGKSACTANLAVGLAQKNMKVLIVDADPQSDVSAGFGYRDCDDSNESVLFWDQTRG